MPSGQSAKNSSVVLRFLDVGSLCLRYGFDSAPNGLAINAFLLCQSNNQDYSAGRPTAEFRMNNKNNRFSSQTPINFMLEGGLKNIIAIRAHLDCAWDWHQSGSTV